MTEPLRELRETIRRCGQLAEQMDDVLVRMQTDRLALVREHRALIAKAGDLLDQLRGNGNGKPRRKRDDRFRPLALERALALRGLSMTDLAQQSGIARSTLERAAAGQTLAPHTIRQLAIFLESHPPPAALRELMQDAKPTD